MQISVQSCIKELKSESFSVHNIAESRIGDCDITLDRSEHHWSAVNVSSLKILNNNLRVVRMHKRFSVWDQAPEDIHVRQNGFHQDLHDVSIINDCIQLSVHK